MPHYKCEPCKARMYVSGGPVDLVGDLCPECGSLLEPVTELTRLVGLRSITSRDAAAAAPQSEPHRRIADLLEALVARRLAMTERDRLDAERFADDSDEPSAAAVVLPPRRTYV